MLGSWPLPFHPNLTNNNCVLTSPKSNGYNCIAWAAGDTTRWWWPVPLKGINYWPTGIPRVETLEAFIQAFGTVGYSPGANASLQDGIEKVAIFALRLGALLVPKHAARQLESGIWTSKMGSLEDITHIACDAVNGPAYGEAVEFLARPRPG